MAAQRLVVVAVAVAQRLVVVAVAAVARSLLPVPGSRGSCYELHDHVEALIVKFLQHQRMKALQHTANP